MDVVEARALLGVGPEDEWPVVRAAFRRLLRATHPDVAAPLADATARTARLTEAYRVARVAHERGDAPAATPRPTTPPAPPAGWREAPPRPAVGVCVEHGALVVRAPAEEAFLRLLEAAHDVGEVTYVDLESGLLETIVHFEGWPVCSVLLTLQGRVSGTEAFCTVEPLETGDPPPLDAVVRTLAARLGADV